VAAACGDRKLQLLRSLGAEAVDYSAPEWTQIVRRETGGTGPDVILDGVGGQIGQDAFTIIAPGAGSPHTGRRVVRLPRSTRPRPNGDR
jgi:NADPH2:quinone reductase